MLILFRSIICQVLRQTFWSIHPNSALQKHHSKEWLGTKFRWFSKTEPNPVVDKVQAEARKKQRVQNMSFLYRPSSGLEINSIAGSSWGKLHFLLSSASLLRNRAWFFPRFFFWVTLMLLSGFPGCWGREYRGGLGLYNTWEDSSSSE